MDRLRLDGFPEAMIEAVDALTRHDGEDDESFVFRAAANPLALPVKRADLEDNLQQALASGGDAERYRYGLSLLEKAGKASA